MGTCNLRGGISALPIFCQGIKYLMEEDPADEGAEGERAIGTLTCCTKRNSGNSYNSRSPITKEIVEAQILNKCLIKPLPNTAGTAPAHACDVHDGLTADSAEARVNSADGNKSCGVNLRSLHCCCIN
ncbi:hypothetical protein EVAR_81433_1 [Eumeta japonica]|uniref:Uncharacterized protein n=1 Tax=Eumeta variegata TaxID=151549 RepID=A0A4C1W0M7_EUMVA|nr:hypothetical protein EVAR_81433_1 [Eumeta japonica]